MLGFESTLNFVVEEFVVTKVGRLVVGLSGASGVVYGIRLLEVLQDRPDIESHLVVSRGALRTIELETDTTLADVEALADQVHDAGDLAASLSSGSFQTMGMVVAPCSMKTLSGIANSYSDNLLVRAADVTLKERRRLVLLPRETPLHLGHARLIVRVIEMGAVVMPPVPALYHRPKSVQAIIDHTVGRVLDMFGVENELVERWSGG
ncbi:MAG: UbiX family flavin prenyltransferase [Actinobacteria bacterium]|nr:UbiX family flavin prenyltransferase [Actinomycetota bacterium]